MSAQPEMSLTTPTHATLHEEEDSEFTRQFDIPWPFPVTLCDEILEIALVPFLKTTSLTEMEMLARKNIILKSIRPTLISFLTKELSLARSHTVKDLDRIITKAIKHLGI
jgi:hypothetical protein